MSELSTWQDNLWNHDNSSSLSWNCYGMCSMMFFHNVILPKHHTCHVMPPWRAWTRHIGTSWCLTITVYLVWRINITDDVINAPLGSCQDMTSTPNPLALGFHVCQTGHVASLSREPVLDRTSRLRLESWGVLPTPSGVVRCPPDSAWCPPYINKLKG